MRPWRLRSCLVRADNATRRTGSVRGGTFTISRSSPVRRAVARRAAAAPVHSVARRHRRTASAAPTTAPSPFRRSVHRVDIPRAVDLRSGGASRADTERCRRRHRLVAADCRRRPADARDAGDIPDSPAVEVAPPVHGCPLLRHTTPARSRLETGKNARGTCVHDGRHLARRRRRVGDASECRDSQVLTLSDNPGVEAGEVVEGQSNRSRRWRSPTPSPRSPSGAQFPSRRSTSRRRPRRPKSRLSRPPAS